MKFLQELKQSAGKLRDESLNAELNGRLTDKQLEFIYENKLFNLFVPTQYGGLSLSLTEALQLEESLAEIDGSLGWTVTLCSGANMFVGFLNQEIAHTLFQNKKVCFGGSGRASGRADVVQDGFLISGKWQYATGTPHNTVFTANCELYKNGQPLLGKDKKAIVFSFFFLKEEISVLNDWNAMGLKATASQSFKVHQLFVADNRAFRIDPAHATLKGLIYQYPFLQLAETTLCVNTLGMTKRFLALCGKIFAERYGLNGTVIQNELLCHNLSTAKQEMGKLRQLLYNLVDRSWLQLSETNHIDLDLLMQLSETCRQLVKTAQHWVTILYPFCGMKAANPLEEINRVWRNLFTASQHSLLALPTIKEIE